MYEKTRVKKSKRTDNVTHGISAKCSTIHIIELVIDSIATRSKSIPGIVVGISIHINVSGINSVVSIDKYKFVKMKTVEL